MPFSVFACGSNGGSQLGFGDDKDRHESERVKFRVGSETTTELSEPIRAMAFGGNYSLAILQDGSLLGAGSNTRGQLFSPEDVRQSSVFRPIESVLGVKFRRIACGWEFSVAETTEGDILVSGYGPNGELGLGKHFSLSTTGRAYAKLPINSESKGGIRQLCTSIHSVIIIFNNGEVYGWGNNKRGQLFAHNGDRTLKLVQEPHRITFAGGRRVLRVCMGRDFTVFMTTDANNEVLDPIFRGKDNFNIESELRSSKIDSDSFASMWATWTSVQVLTRDNHILSIGSNIKCQHYPKNADNCGPIDLVAIGSEHGVCTLDNDRTKAYAWGWGEHGNCGSVPDHMTKDGKPARDTFDHLNTIYEARKDEKITKVFAGCATSFVEVEKLKKQAQ